jgi:NAD(P)-dependent dehydrogenase (short-subunit alcohol dehydrogenase family)
MIPSLRASHVLVGVGVALALGARALRKRNRRFPDQVVLITGGSRGLGLELGREFSRRGAHVALCARDSDTLLRARDDLSRRGASVLALTGDVGNVTDARAVVQQVTEHFGGIDVLVNNAGTITVGPLETLTPADFEEALRTNFWGAVHTTLAALPSMRARGSGRIVNIVSIGGKIAVPHLLPYTASKFALAGFSEGLAAEVRSQGIAVTTVYPGLMRTGSARHALFKGQHRAEYAWFSIADAIPGVAMHVARAARRIADACALGVPDLVLTLPARLAITVHGVLPRTTTRLLELVSRLLPSAEGGVAHAVRGRDSTSPWSPSILTRPAERAAQTQNQV